MNAWADTILWLKQEGPPVREALISAIFPVASYWLTVLDGAVLVSGSAAALSAK